MNTRGCSAPAPPRSARRLRTTAPSSTASSRPGSTPRGWSCSIGSAACTAARRGGQRLALLARPQPRGAGQLVGGGQTLGGLDQRRQHLGRAAPRPRRRGAGRRQAAAPAGPAGPRSRGVRAAPPACASATAQPGQPGARARAAQAGAAPGARAAARQAAGVRPAAASGCFSSASSGTGASCSATAARQQAQEHRGRRVGQLFAGAVVGDDAVAQQLGRHPAGQRRGPA